MDLAASDARRGSIVGAGLVVLGLAAFADAVIEGRSLRYAALLAVGVTALAVGRLLRVEWRHALAALVLIILLVPIRRYTLPGSLPFELEPYRLAVMLLIVAWVASLLSDPRVRLHATGFEAPLALVVGATLASVAANPDRVAALSGVVTKKLMFFFSFVLVLYLCTSVARRLESIDLLAKALAAGGAFVALFAIVEQRTGFNLFNHLDEAIPILRVGADGQPEAFQKYGAAKLRVFASAQHPIALSAALVLLTPIAVYLAQRTRQRRWLLATILLVAGVAATVSRTGVVMLLVVGAVFVWLKPRDARRLWPLVIPALILIKVALPGTLGAIKQSFTPAGGLIAEQQAQPGESGSGRLADLGPGLAEWKQQPLLGQGYGTRAVDVPVGGSQANILDNQWLGTLLETGALGLVGWVWLFARVVRRFGRAAKDDDSPRGWLLVALAAGIAAFAVGMVTFDSFAFIQVTFLVFVYIALGASLVAERHAPLVRARRHTQT